MNAATRKKLLAWAIPLDLVVVATGVGLVIPGISLLTLIGVFVVAVALSAFKSGWLGALAAMALSSILLFTLFRRTVSATEIGEFVAAALLVSIPLAAWHGQRRKNKAWEEQTHADLEAVPPSFAALIAVQRTAEEPQAAAAAVDKQQVMERETRARAEGERIAAEKKKLEEDFARRREQYEREHAERLSREKKQMEDGFARMREQSAREYAERFADEKQRLEGDFERTREQIDREHAERFAIEKKKLEDDAARTRGQIEREHAERFAAERKKIEEDFARAREQIERDQAERSDGGRAELKAAYDSELAAMKAKFDAARLEFDVERVELQNKLDDERARPEVVEKQVDDEAIDERLEHMRAELQQQFERDLKQRIAVELAAQRRALEHDSEQEIAKVRTSADDRVATFRAELERVLAEQAAALSPMSSRSRQATPAQSRGIFSRFFGRSALSVGESTATRRAAVAAVADSSATRRAHGSRSRDRKARILFLESRRAIADTAAPRLKQLGIEVVIVERLVDAVDELYRFRPDVMLIDAELPDFEVAYKTIAGQAAYLPVVLTARSASSIPDIGRAGIAIRPYVIDEIVDLAHAALSDPTALLARQNKVRAEAPQPSKAVVPQVQETVSSPARDSYDIVCDNCHVVFDATEADWCSCLTRERTVVCTNCLTCFCKAPPAYKEVFWLGAPQRLLENKGAEQRRKSLVLTANVPPGEIKRPLVMFVEDDEDIQAVMQRVSANLGYGSVSAINGREGMDVARAYRPNLILSDAFLPQLDGREMCRLLKQDPAFASTKMVVMTGLYADIQYKSEAIKRFRLDDCLAKPVSITDLINLLQRNLEGVLFLPRQENLHELHRKEIDAASDAQPAVSTFEVACSHCGDMFDAVKAEWCTCAGGDNTFVCEHCGNCFCKAPEYRRRFWSSAPAVLFERKLIVSRRESPPNPRPGSVKRPIVLVVEDDEAVQLIVRTVASTMGYGFIDAGNGEEALALARDHQPDLVFADAWTPKLDGREMCRQLKEGPTGAHVKTIVMTGRYADGEYRREAASQFKVDDCIAKPLVVDDLLRMVKKHLPQEVRAM